MNNKFNAIKLVIKKEGWLALFQKRQVYHHLLFPFFYLWSWLRIKFFKSQDIKKIVDFIFSLGFGFFDPIQLKSEIISLLEIVKTAKPRVILEIGTAKGGTLFLFSRIADNKAEIISLDLDASLGKYGGGYPVIKKPLFKSFAQAEQAIHLIRADSHKESTKEKVKGLLQDKLVDFLFIDADHTYEGVKKDFLMYSELVRPGGLVAFHDIITANDTDDYGVERFWNEIKNNYEHFEFIEDRSLRAYGIGLLIKTE
ncbi:MAG: class I SAM-dependent methyltransferase [Patescibacteria group bacterium]|nr:MAG: class I SAM-dependent methyltransferase [Patescibacteria group bacterium]